MISKTKIKILKLIYLAFFLIGAYLAFLSVKILNLYTLGQIFGVWALTSLSFQFVLISRFKPLERGVGLDRIMRWHGANAALIILFGFLHPIFVFATLNVFVIFASLNFVNFLGPVVLALLLFTYSLTKLSFKLQLNYEHWKIIHKIGYVIVTLGFIHSFFSGTTIFPGSPLYYWWFVLFLMAILGTTLRLYKLYFGKKEYKVTSIKKESQNVWTVCLKPVQNKFSFCPGQFAFVTFLTSRLPKEEHHFTLSSAPTSEEISFTIKEIGDFTSLIKNLKVGDKALVDGPYGIFTNYNLEGPFLFIAGGIGITPVISMLRSMKDKNENTLLIYAAKALDEIPFHSELEKLRSSKWFKIWLCFSEKAPQGKYVFQGHIDKNILKKVANLRKRKIFLVGPEPMMNSVQKDLLDLGVEKENIFSERFALR